MRKQLSLLLLVVSLALIGLGIYQYVRQREAASSAVTIRLGTVTPIVGVARISVEDLYRELQSSSPPLVWELRSAASYAEGHVPGSRFVQTDQIQALAQDLDRGQPIVTLCA